MGSSYTGDIAIDDVTIFSGSCYSPTVLLTNQSIGGTLMPLFIRLKLNIEGRLFKPGLTKTVV